MIILHRLNGATLGLNPDLIERIEANPDTVVTLTDGKKILVRETIDDIVELVTDYRAFIVARSHSIEVFEAPRPELELIPGTATDAETDTKNQLDEGEAELIDILVADVLDAQDANTQRRSDDDPDTHSNNGGR